MDTLYTVEVFFKNEWHGVFSSFDENTANKKQKEYENSGFTNAVRVTMSEFKYDKKWSGE